MEEETLYGGNFLTRVAATGSYKNKSCHTAAGVEQSVDHSQACRPFMNNRQPNPQLRGSTNGQRELVKPHTKH